ncbi:MAG: helix-turn-helix domain-containing protein [Sedimentisphaerales bacterium]|nr:helix-turn-helix domain-containing protein [Sedimentisphaerales bacterium]
MSLGEILRQKRQEMDLTLDEVSVKVGFSKPYLSTIETGRVSNPPSDELLRKLEHVLKFDKGQLLHLAHIEKMAPDVREMFEASEAERERLRRMIKNLSQDKSVGNTEAIQNILKVEEQSTLSAGRLVPVINKVSAGYPTDFDDLDYPVGVADDYIRCPDVHDPHAFAVRVVGDSMEPKFKEGDFVVFSPQAQVVNGDDCFIRFTSPHETTFKRVFFEQNDSIRLQPRNEKYAPITVENNKINGLYRAIAKVERL